MRAPLMGGGFPYPVKYGYATVGRVAAGPAELRDRVVFSLTRIRASSPCRAAMVVPVPENVPAQRARSPPTWRRPSRSLGWRAGPGRSDRGRRWRIGGTAGRVSLRAIAGSRCDGGRYRLQARRARSSRRRQFAAPDAAPTDCDLVFHASASAAGLATALRLAGEEAGIVELSWYGSNDIAAPLGGAFHSRRLRLLSSQVGKVAPSHRARWTHGRRLAAALALLSDSALDAYRPSRGFRGSAAKLASIFDPASDVICQLIAYPMPDATH